MYIKDLETGKVRRYGTNPHDSLVISEDGRTLAYYNLQNGDGSRHGGYVFCDEKGKTPAEIDFHTKYGADIYFNIGGCKGCREGIEQKYQALRRLRPQPVIEEEGIAARCPYCEASAWMTNADEELNNYCGLCGQRLDWEHPENPDEEEAEADE